LVGDRKNIRHVKNSDNYLFISKGFLLNNWRKKINDAIG